MNWLFPSLLYFLIWCFRATYNYTSVHCVPLVLVHRVRLHLPDLTWRRRSHSRSYTTNCPNFNLGAIVCEPAYDSSFALIGLGHMQSFTAKGARANLSWWKVVQAHLQSWIYLFWDYGYWNYSLYKNILITNTGGTTDESFQSMNCRFISWRFFVWDLPQNRRFWARASRVAPTFCKPVFPYCSIFCFGSCGRHQVAPTIQQDFGLGHKRGRPCIATRSYLYKFLQFFIVGRFGRGLGRLGPGWGFVWGWSCLFGLLLRFLVQLGYRRILWPKRKSFFGL